LALKDAGKENGYVNNQFKGLLSTAYWWYQNSPLNFARSPTRIQLVD